MTEMFWMNLCPNFLNFDWLEAFDEAIDFFTKSWSLWDPLLESLRTTSLDKLSDYELGYLVQLLRSSCNEELVISVGDGMELLTTACVNQVIKPHYYCHNCGNKWMCLRKGCYRRAGRN